MREKWMSDELDQAIVKKACDITTEEGKAAMVSLLLKNEQAPINIVHRFGGGLYIREASYCKGTYIVGQRHVSEHMNVLLKGKILVVDGDGKSLTLEAPHMFVAKAGSKVGYCLEDVVWQNIYVTDSTDVEYLESILFKDNEEAIEKREEDYKLEYNARQEDRDDYALFLEESKMTEGDVVKISSFRGDCIPLPPGSYSFASGKSAIQGKGLFATSYIHKGHLVASMTVGGLRTPVGYLTNHANMFLVAKRDIGGMMGGELGEELTVDYRQVFGEARRHFLKE
jgi:hypothetical protein